VNIMIKVNALKVNGNELANIDKAQTNIKATVDVGKTVLHDVSINKNEIQNNQPAKKIVDEYDELI